MKDLPIIYVLLRPGIIMDLVLDSGGWYGWQS
jgi:hypothetical protein